MVPDLRHHPNLLINVKINRNLEEISWQLRQACLYYLLLKATNEWCTSPNREQKKKKRKENWKRKKSHQPFLRNIFVNIKLICLRPMIRGNCQVWHHYLSHKSSSTGFNTTHNTTEYQMQTIPASHLKIQFYST